MCFNPSPAGWWNLANMDVFQSGASQDPKAVGSLASADPDKAYGS